MNIIEQIEKLPSHSLELDATFTHADTTKQFHPDCLDIRGLKALKESHEQLLKAAKPVYRVAERSTVEFDELKKAIEQAEKLYEHTPKNRSSAG